MSPLQSQPYIMIRERLSVSEIRKIARENGLSDSEINSITGDADKDYLVGNKDDVDENGKATCVRYYEKIDGVVHMARACRTCEFVPLHPVKRTQIKGIEDFPSRGIARRRAILLTHKVDQPREVRFLELCPDVLFPTLFYLYIHTAKIVQMSGKSK